MSISATVTILVLLAFIIVGLVPKLPAFAKVLIQVCAGVGIYFGLSDAMFGLPYSDNLPISDLFGGSGGQEGFNKLSMGVVCTGVGLLFTLLGTGIAALLRKKAE
jgi:hypothetical protein